MMTPRALIVDDEEHIREVARLSLETMGDWEVHCARSGHEALELARRSRPDVVLLDVMMPDLDGPSTLRRLREEAALGGIPVIFLTAKVQSRERRHLADLGIAGVIAKPFDPLTLSDQVLRLMGVAQ